MVDKPTCYLCGRDEPQVLFTQTSPGPIVQCRSCGLVYVSPISLDRSRAYDLHLTPEQRKVVEQQLSEDDFVLSGSLVAANMPDFDLMLKDFHAKLAVLQEYGKIGGKLLDVGAHSGVLLYAARERGYEPYGVEPDVGPCVYARQRWGLNMFCGPLYEARFPDNYFDVVTMLAVLEHMRNPLAELREVKRVLKPDGMLVVEVPNIDSLLFKVTCRYWRHFIEGHYIHFTPDTLTLFLARAGFSVAEIRSFRRSTTLRRLLTVGKGKSFAKLFGVSVLLNLADTLVEKLGLSEIVIAIDPGDNMTAYILPSHIGTEFKLRKFS